jgi:hypothetical protein
LSVLLSTLRTLDNATLSKVAETAYYIPETLNCFFISTLRHSFQFGSCSSSGTCPERFPITAASYRSRQAIAPEKQNAPKNLSATPHCFMRVADLNQQISMGNGAAASTAFVSRKWQKTESRG